MRKGSNRTVLRPDPVFEAASAVLRIHCHFISHSQACSFPRQRGFGKGFAECTRRLPNGIAMQRNARPARKAGMGAMFADAPSSQPSLRLPTTRSPAMRGLIAQCPHRVRCHRVRVTALLRGSSARTQQHRENFHGRGSKQSSEFGGDTICELCRHAQYQSWCQYRVLQPARPRQLRYPCEPLQGRQADSLPTIPPLVQSPVGRGV